MPRITNASSGDTVETSKARLYFTLCLSICRLTLSGFPLLHTLSDSLFPPNICPHHMCFERALFIVISRKSNLQSEVSDVPAMFKCHVRYKFLIPIAISPNASKMISAK